MADLRLLTVPRTQHVMSWAWRGASTVEAFPWARPLGERVL